jgi:ubiquinol-cytochrome c reductase cytochrome b subunit
MFRWLSRFAATASDRIGYAPFKRTVLNRRVPKTPWYQGDGATLTTLLLIQVVTGVTMTLYYTNAAEHAYDSVQYISNQLTLGWLVRGIHYWTAGFMVVMMVIHVFRHLVEGGYKAPREGTWVIGVLQFWLVLTMSFTGYVLRWDERAVYAARVALNMFYKVPLIGEYLVLIIQGGPQLGSTTLTRMFSVHIWIVPLFLLGLVGIHLFLVVYHGVTSKAEQKKSVATAEEQKKVYKAVSESAEGGEWFHPQTMFLTGSMAFAVFTIIFVVALVVGPREMYPEGNLVAQSFPKEEWWFWWYSSAIALLPPLLSPAFLVGFPLLLFIGMFLLPFLDRGPNRGLRKRPIWTILVVFSVIGLLWLSDLRTRSPWTGWPDPEPPKPPHGFVLSESTEMGRLRFAEYGCNSCHAVSGQGRRVGPDLARIDHPFSVQWMRDFVLAPPRPVAMPAYKGHITEEALGQLVDFLMAAQTFPRE